jgi:N-acetylmuramoyl-L-alanine amidase
MCLRRLRPRSWRLTVVAIAVLTLASCTGSDDVRITGEPTTQPGTPPTIGGAKAAEPAPPKSVELPAPGTVAVRTPTGVIGLWMGVEGAGSLVRTPCGVDVAVTTVARVEPVEVVLDPGHGGLDPGAVSSTGVSEAELNLDIARRVRDILRSRGTTVELTRDGDWFRTIADRAALATALAPRAFVSIHHNGGTHPPLRLGPGTEVYHEREDAESRRLGGILFEDVVAGLSQFDVDWVASQYRGALWRADRDGDDFYGLLRRADTMPAVILEAAYLTGDAESQLVTTTEFRAAEAESIARGIERWLNSADPGSGYLDGFTLGGSAGSFDMSRCEDPSLE